jgi:serine-type D-Ala-D-Ala carboxypeptidase (penicillin-binding protein 5/6)
MSLRRLSALLILIAVSARPASAQTASPDPAPAGIAAKAWIITDGRTGKIVGGFHESEKRAIASITKIMTASIVLQLAEKSPGVLDEMIAFSERAAHTSGSSSHLRAGEKLPVRELLYGLLLPSGNDAAVAIAEHFGPRFPAGTSAGEDPVKRFVEEMNREAKRWQLADTSFLDPNGLALNQSTARDLASLAFRALQNKQFRNYVKTRSHEYEVESRDGSKRRVTWKNTNQLLGEEEYDGIKTGTTSAAGACLVASGHKGPDGLIVIILGSTGGSGRYEDARKLFHWGWEHLAK